MGMAKTAEEVGYLEELNNVNVIIINLEEVCLSTGKSMLLRNACLLFFDHEWMMR